MVLRTGIRRAMVNRSQPHFWSWSRVAISPGGKIPHGPSHQSLSDRSRVERALVSPRQAVVWGDGSGSWLALWSLLRPLVALACGHDVSCPSHMLGTPEVLLAFDGL